MNINAPIADALLQNLLIQTIVPHTAVCLRVVETKKVEREVIVTSTNVCAAVV